MLKTTIYHKYTLAYQKKKNVKENVIIVYAQTALHFALNIGSISTQFHMLLFVICFSS
jgi:hypothetical protein